MGEESYRKMKKRVKSRGCLKGSLTVEMSFLMPMILFLIMGCILAAFYYHDKLILTGAAYETAVAGSTKAREKDGVKAGQLESLFDQRVKGKCILASNAQANVKVRKDEIEVNAIASYGQMKISVVTKAAVTEPEKHIRDMQRLKEK